ncbi:nuclear transport factor 2 family protein [Novosphingobium sp. 9U]|uniref:nuclear transport factor 2 family protein n=1 Tax=Novosphingobium sp. 9U TaxID=2653158 RepID=UPI0012F0B3A2|nr:nuclear transport factor 2 family protein [Novosphingobium sp. 9U]VWX53121.1 conserved hypothetical protein [Novosphingobium sp. 9U]
MNLELRLDRLESEAAIAGLVHAYALAIRRDRPEDVAALFAPAGTFEVREGAPDRDDASTMQRFDDPPALVAYLLQGKGRPHPVPMIHNLIIKLNGNDAHASSVMVGPIPGTTHQVLGEYADSFVRLDGSWYFSARIFTVFR